VNLGPLASSLTLSIVAGPTALGEVHVDSKSDVNDVKFKTKGLSDVWVVRNTIVPGGHTGWHRHNHDYVVVPVTTGELHIFDGKTTVPAPLRAGVSYARQIGVEHDVINPNNFEFVFVEIELKA
jgi:quercetin dioxygenase-like cupin family protein